MCRLSVESDDGGHPGTLGPAHRHGGSASSASALPRAKTEFGTVGLIGLTTGRGEIAARLADARSIVTPWAS
jgi:hypothetical protein